MINRRQFMKIAGVTVASVPLLSLTKKEDVPDKVEVPKGVYGVFCVHGRRWKVRWMNSEKEKYYMPVETENLEVALSDTPHIFRSDTTIACFIMHDAYYLIDRLVITYVCNDPKFFLGDDDKLHRYGGLA